MEGGPELVSASQHRFFLRDGQKTAITLLGYRFGSEEGTVLLNGHAISVDEWTAHEIRAKLPGLGEAREWELLNEIAEIQVRDAQGRRSEVKTVTLKAEGE